MVKSNMKRDLRIPTLSMKQAVILELLLAGPSSGMYGLELVRKSAGGLKRGTVYVTLTRMEDKGYVESRQDESEADTGILPRRLYRPTGYGQRVYEAWQLARHAAEWLFAGGLSG